LGLGACTDEAVEAHALPASKAIRASGPLDLRLVMGDAYELSVQGPEAAVAGFEFTVDGEQLSLNASGQRVVVDVFITDLERVEVLRGVRAELPRLAGAGALRLAAYADAELVVAAATADAVDVRASGDARVAIDDVLAETVQVLAAGRSAVALSGEAGMARIEAGGSAQVSAENLRVQDMTVTSRGDSVATLWATAHIQGQVADRSQVRLRGRPDESVVTGDEAHFERSTVD
jgi:hypothetical protein